MIGREQVAARVPRGTLALLDKYVGALLGENERQNLIARSTTETVWQRHVLDSLQLLDLAPPAGLWVDIGAGAGLPGMVVAIASERPVVLIEPRARRAAFLVETIGKLGLSDRVQVSATRVQNVVQTASVISARAVATMTDTFAMASHLADTSTCWLLPKGRSVAAEVANARKTWQADIELVPSLTDADARIVVARNVCRRGRS